VKGLSSPLKRITRHAEEAMLWTEANAESSLVSPELPRIDEGRRNDYATPHAWERRLEKKVLLRVHYGQPGGGSKNQTLPWVNFQALPTITILRDAVSSITNLGAT